MQLDGQYANEQFTQECDQPDEITPESECLNCFHKAKSHDASGKCQADRTIHSGDVEIDVPCDCEGFE